MNTAFTIFNRVNNNPLLSFSQKLMICFDLCKQAETLRDTEEDFSKEMTSFIFDDGSVLRFTCDEFWVGRHKEASKKVWGYTSSYMQNMVPVKTAE